MPHDHEFRAAYLSKLSLDKAALDLEFAVRARTSSTAAAASDVARGFVRAEALNVAMAFAPKEAVLSEPFDPWKAPGEKHLEHTGDAIILTLQDASMTIRIRLPSDVTCGANLALLVSMGHRFRRSTAAATQANDALFGRRRAAARAWRPGSQQILAMRSLIPLDAHLAGATYRQVAEALFGVNATQERWTRDPTLKEQVRYLVRKGLERMRSTV